MLGVTAVDKPQHVWCRHCMVGEGCAIHAERPQMCRDFFCMYVTPGSGLGEHWLPARSGMVLCAVPSVPRIEVHVADSRPDAWRQAPYLGELRAFSRAALQARGYVMVYEPGRIHAILPDRIVDLGEPHPDKRIVQVLTMTPSGPVVDIEQMMADDPRLAGAWGRPTFSSGRGEDGGFA